MSLISPFWCVTCIFEIASCIRLWHFIDAIYFVLLASLISYFPYQSCLISPLSCVFASLIYLLRYTPCAFDIPFPMCLLRLWFPRTHLFAMSLVSPLLYVLWIYDIPFPLHYIEKCYISEMHNFTWCKCLWCLFSYASLIFFKLLLSYVTWIVDTNPFQRVPCIFFWYTLYLA